RTVSGSRLTTTYLYDTGGSQTNVIYSDATPGITNTYDRLGRQVAVAQGATTASLYYNQANALLSEAYAGGILDGLRVTNVFDQFLRRTNFSAFYQLTTLNAINFTYDAASRLSTVSQP